MPGMPQNFLDCGREQAFLLPPSLRDWLPEDHLAWFVLATVSELDLAAFYAAYRPDGHGRAAYDPRMMACFCTRIRRRCTRRAISSVTAVKTLRIGCSLPIGFPITRRSRGSWFVTRGRWPSCSAGC